MNYEEGGERSILHGDRESEAFLHEVVATEPLPGAAQPERRVRLRVRQPCRVLASTPHVRRRKIPITVYAVAMALERHPGAATALVEAGHEVMSHGWRWIDYQYVNEDEERAHLKRAVDILTRLTGSRPLGWYTGRQSPNTRRLVVEEGGFLYDADAYNDDLPYWVTVSGKGHLVIPYTLDNNDMKFGVHQGFNTGEDFYAYLRDAFDVLYAEGATAPKMMSVGPAPAPRRSARARRGLARFLDHVQKHEGVWICRRVDIARHWIATHPYPGPR